MGTQELASSATMRPHPPAGRPDGIQWRLVNALLGRPVLPSGVAPLTVVATTVRYGEDPRAEVRFAAGHEEKYPLAVRCSPCYSR